MIFDNKSFVGYQTKMTALKARPSYLSKSKIGNRDEQKTDRGFEVD
jgi:hypothetical protein